MRSTIPPFAAATNPKVANASAQASSLSGVLTASRSFLVTVVSASPS